MDHVLTDGQSEVSADGARGGLGHWIGATGQLTPRVDGALAFNDSCNQWRRGDEVNQFAEERLVGVLFVVLFSGLAVCSAQIQFDELETLTLDASEDLSYVAVGLSLIHI